MLAKNLVALLDEYVVQFDTGTPTASLKEEVRKAALLERELETFQFVASAAWDKYFCVDPEVLIFVLRRWVELAPECSEAKWNLGSYMLAHGPDWDEEARALLGSDG